LGPRGERWGRNGRIATGGLTLKQQGSNDPISVSAMPMKNGCTSRLEVQEGVLKAIGEAVKRQ
jgi:hypothetical protein